MTAQAMVLKTLSIRDENYYSSSQPPKYTGTIEFRCGNGDINLKLNSDLSQRLLAVVGEAMVESTKEVARNLTAEVLSGIAALPAPKAEPVDEDIF
jgi:hypothetical protein